MAYLFPQSVEDIPASFRPAFRSQRRFLIDGQLRSWGGNPGEELAQVHSPIAVRKTDGSLAPIALGEYPLVSPEVGMEMLAAAKRAYGEGRGVWPSMSVEGRIACVEKFLGKMRERRTEIAALIMTEICKTEADAYKEVDRTVEYIEKTIQELRALAAEDSCRRQSDGYVARVERRPIGTVYSVAPFNYPLNETFTRLLPAVLMGNTAILKPARIGVLLLDPLQEAFQECFPPGVMNVLYCDAVKVVPPMLRSGEVDSIAFIGSTGVAKRLIEAHPHPYRLIGNSVFDLGAMNPGVVLPDYDPAVTIPEVMQGTLSFNGQRCTALKRLFVHRSVAKDFCDQLCRAVDTLPLGMPWDKDVKITPLAEPGKPEAMRAYIEDAVSKGARVANEGGGTSEGQLFRPAVLFDVKPGMKIFEEEQFGPVIPVIIYDDVEEVIRWQSGCPFKQQVALFGSDTEQLAHLAGAFMRMGVYANINMQCQRGPDEFPFGGVQDAGSGSLTIRDTLLRFSNEVLVRAKSKSSSADIV